MMKKLIIRITGVMALVTVVGFSACDDPEKTAEEKFMDKISGNWTAAEIKLDGTVIENAFAGFSLSITPDKKFTTTHGNDPIWGPAGSFTLEATNTIPEFDLIRNDGVELEVEQLDDENVILSFHYESTGGRANGVTGDYVFTLSR
jgi:hypothetical protein